MPTIKVNTSKLGSYESDLQSILCRVNSINSQFSSVSRNLDWDIKAASNINSRMSAIERELSAESRGISGMKTYLGSARTKYDAVENRNKKVKNDGLVTGSVGKTSVSGKGSLTKKTELYQVENGFIGKNTVIGGNNTSVTKGTIAAGSGQYITSIDSNKTYTTADPNASKSKYGKIASDAVVTGATSATKWLFGYKAEGSLEGSILGYELNSSAGAEWDLKNGEAGATWKASADGYAAKGKTTGKYGITSLVAIGTVGAVGASGEIGATLMKNGKFAPSINAEAEASATAAKGDIEAQVGSDDNNVHAKASGELATAEAKASAKVGKIEYEDASGNTMTGWGAEAEVGAEAYVAKGSISGGISIFGIDVDVEIEGKAGGGGAEAGGSITSSSATGELGLGLLVGLGAKVKVDWSDFTLLKK